MEHARSPNSVGYSVHAGMPRKPSVLSAGAHLAFLHSCNSVAFLQEDNDICI